jgi:hypothetical protein
MLGPVQVLVVGVSDADRVPDVMGSLAALHSDGPVACLDVFEVTVGQAGDLAITALDPTSTPPSLPLFAEPVDGVTDVQSVEGMWHIGEVVPAGSRAIVALLEHRWALGLRDSMRAAGAALLHETWLDEDDRATLDALLSARIE